MTSTTHKNRSRSEDDEDENGNRISSTSYEFFEDEHDDNDTSSSNQQRIPRGPLSPQAPAPVPSTLPTVQVQVQIPTTISSNMKLKDDTSSSFSDNKSIQTFSSMPHLTDSASHDGTAATRSKSSSVSASASAYAVPLSSSYNHNSNTSTARRQNNRKQKLLLFQRSSLSRSSFAGVDRLPGAHQNFRSSLPLIIFPKKLKTPQFRQGFGLSLLVVLVMVGIMTSSYTSHVPDLRVAFVGNSMMYYNDMPRFLEALSGNTIEQDCCLHGDASLHNILLSGSGTFKIWRTGVAQIRDVNVTLMNEYNNNNNNNQNNYQNSKRDFTRLYDYGACTVPQLLFGYDATLDQKMQDWNFDRSYAAHGDDFFDDDDYYTMDNDDYDFDSFMDGLNPCLMDPNYYNYRKYQYLQQRHYDNLDIDDDDDMRAAYYSNQGDRIPTPPHWDYIVMNDNTRSPASAQGRMDALSILEQKYLLWFQETGATPILMFTYAYDTPYRDMQGLSDIPTFTSLTYEGYRQYAALLAQRLPEAQAPRIAMVGLAFLTIWEEHYDFWNENMFHVDRIHASPHGTFLQGCVVYCTLYDKMPLYDIAIGQLESLWNNARRMAPVRHRRAQFPTKQDAIYLYHIAERVCLHGHVPKSFIFYENGEANDYSPTDDLFKDNDLY